MRIAKNSSTSATGISLYEPLLIVLLGLGWLLPNHYPPWNTFHTEAWVGCMLLVISLWGLCKSPRSINVSWPAIFLISLALIPWLQYAMGELTLVGSTLLVSFFLFSFGIAYTIGWHWNINEPGRIAGIILTAAAFAGIASVGLQLYQWAGFAKDQGFDQIWVFAFSGKSRPFANLGQPNQLASLLLWGALGIAWALHRQWIGRITAWLASLFLMLGVALTGSRTAALSLTVGIVVLSVWRPQFLPRKVLRALQILFVGYLIFLMGLGPLSDLLWQDDNPSSLSRGGGELRLAIWKMALDASTLAPWLGYGWNETTEAYLRVYPSHPQLADIYVAQSHNLFLDLVLWIGWPGALSVLVLASIWFYRLLKSISSPERLILLASLAVMLVHAMLELPLHYGYFLWPFGMLAGAAAAAPGMPSRPAFQISHRAAIGFLAGVCVFASTTIHDYFNVEQSFANLRFQLLRLGANHDETPPKTYLLNEWPDFIAMARIKPVDAMTGTQIYRWQELLLFQPSPIAFRQLVEALALNGRREEAEYWAIRSCSVIADKACKALITHLGPTPRGLE